MILIIVKWSFRGRMCKLEYSYLGQWATNVDFVHLLIVQIILHLSSQWRLDGGMRCLFVWCDQDTKENCLFLFVSVMCLLEKRLDSLLGGRLGWLVGGG